MLIVDCPRPCQVSVASIHVEALALERVPSAELLQCGTCFVGMSMTYHPVYPDVGVGGEHYGAPPSIEFLCRLSCNHALNDVLMYHNVQGWT